MQREIKFRAWIKANKRMELCVDVNPFYIGDCDRLHWKHNEVELMQYTGLNDNSDCLPNGQEDKEVFEGDIISVGYKDKAIKACVKFEMGMFIMVSDEFEDGYIPIYEVANQDRDYGWIDGIVIGNIYENPELLEIK
ncbi:MAG: hypothetical protein K0S04_316 [Herbinix sp.]|jgi:uncharacterized phage protein (TIGR01671 family)|nr:hypothetical protein [Herbinix sp.]